MEACALNRCVYLSKSREPRRGKKGFQQLFESFEKIVK